MAAEIVRPTIASRPTNRGSQRKLPLHSVPLETRKLQRSPAIGRSCRLLRLNEDVKLNRGALYRMLWCLYWFLCEYNFIMGLTRRGRGRRWLNVYGLLLLLDRYQAVSFVCYVYHFCFYIIAGRFDARFKYAQRFMTQWESYNVVMPMLKMFFMHGPPRQLCPDLHV